MASPVQVCNRALSRIGIDQLIEDLTDPTTRARACLQHYDDCRIEMLQDFPWGFAQKVVQLAKVAGVTVPGWRYAYRYPTDCLRAQQVTDKAGGRGATGNIFRDIWSYDLPGEMLVRVPFSIMADPLTDGTRILVTDLEMAHLWYTADVGDINQFPPLARSALSWKIASEIALVLRADTRLQQNAVQQYAWVVSQAQVGTQQEGVADKTPTPDSIRVRA